MSRSATTVEIQRSNKKFKKVDTEPDQIDTESEAEEMEESDDSENNEASDDAENNEANEASESEVEEESDNSESAEDSDSTDLQTQPNESKFMGNPALADVFSKILKTNKPKKKKTLVLSRAKKISDVVPKEIKVPASFQVEGETGEIKKEEIIIKTVEIPSEKQEKKPHRLSVRSKPSFSDRTRERSLQKIATKGVVQLFNAVKQQQLDLDKKLSEAGPLERKREKVLKSIDKSAFLDGLMGGSKSIPVTNTKTETKTEAKPSENLWGVLRDDFVMGAKLKDWDKNASDEEASSEAEDMDSD